MFVENSTDILKAHSYQYSFEPNPRWSAFYAPAAEIRGYLHGVAEKYGVLRHIKTNHKVIECVWDESAKKWFVYLYLYLNFY